MRYKFKDFVANKNQQEAIMHPLAPLIILASAGTGKTATIIHRIVHMVTHKNIDPSSILTITYTEKAAQELNSINVNAFKNYFIEGALLYFSASMIKRSWDGSLMLKLNKVHLLSDVSSKLIREIQFKLSSETLDQSIIDKILIIFCSSLIIGIIRLT